MTHNLQLKYTAGTRLSLFTGLLVSALVLGAWQPGQSAQHFEEAKRIQSIHNQLIQELNKTIIDQKPGFSSSEARLIITILKNLNNSSEINWAKRAEIPDGSSLFEQLVKYPQIHRGNLLTITGEITEIQQTQLKTTEPAGKLLFRWRMIPDGSTRLPVYAFSTALPEDLEVGKNLLIRGKLTGLFIKNIALPQAEVTSIAPLMLTSGQLFERDQSTPAGELPPELWSVVKHKALGVRGAESDLYYRLLNLSSSISLKQQEDSAKKFLMHCRSRRARYKNKPHLKFPVFYDLFQHYREYEGKQVTLKGVARVHRRYPAGKNDFGITFLHELWVFSEDSQRHPAVIVCTQVPKNIPLGDEIAEMVQATGYFFKMYGYQAQDKPRFAPMLLAGGLQWFSSVEIQQTTSWKVFATVALVFGFALWGLYRMYRTDRQQRNRSVTIEPDFSQLHPRSQDDNLN